MTNYDVKDLNLAEQGRIEIFDSHSTVELPDGMPSEIYHRLRKAWVCGQKLAISVDSGGPPAKLPPAAERKVKSEQPRHKRPGAAKRGERK